MRAAGPKMRKWYGETEKLTLAHDDGGSPEDTGADHEQDEGPRNAVLVTDADSPLGTLIVLQLVLSRCGRRTAALASLPVVMQLAVASQNLQPWHPSSFVAARGAPSCRGVPLLL
jgi:hypothetical protein